MKYIAPEQFPILGLILFLAIILILVGIGKYREFRKSKSDKTADYFKFTGEKPKLKN